MNDKKTELLTEDLPDIYTLDSKTLLANRFLKTTSDGKPSEKVSDMFKRVSDFVAAAESNYYKRKDKIKKEKSQASKDFFEVLYNLKLIPNTPTLINAGRFDRLYSACFVLPAKDNLDDLMQSIRDATVIHQYGGGTGWNFSEVREKGAPVNGIEGVAAGPVHFIKTYSRALEGIRQLGKRGGGNMAILNIDHPDIEEFIELKKTDRSIMNFNISVGITDKFMEALRNDEDFNLVSRFDQSYVKSIRAKDLFDKISEVAWESGDPGLAFVDKINDDSPTPNMGVMNATNPCGEQPLLPYESCNLAALNLRVHFNEEKKELDWKELRNTIKVGVHFLDNIIDVNNYPIKQIEKVTRFTNRKIGLGLMGFADVLFLKGIPYNSKEALDYAERVMAFIRRESHKASVLLAKERGTFPNFKGSKWDKIKMPLRNATVTTIAPNGNTSIIGGSVGGIEPAYSLAYKVAGIENSSYHATTVLFRVNEAFKAIAKREGFYSDELIEKISEGAKIQDINEIPEEWKKVFVTAMDISPMDHIKMQDAFQKNTDNAISKTINLPNSATLEDVRNIYLYAYDSSCKGVTIFRDGCKSGQTYVVNGTNGKLNIETNEETEEAKDKIIIISRNDKKIAEFREYLSKTAEFKNLQIDVCKDNLDSKINISVRNNEDLITRVARKAKYIGKERNSLTIADSTYIYTIETPIKKKILDVLYFGKQDDYSAELFTTLKASSKKDGLKARISSNIALYLPKKDLIITGLGETSGKIVPIEGNKYTHAFVHDSLLEFDITPTKEEFHEHHHRKLAFDNLIRKYQTILGSLSQNALQVLEKRALKKDEKGKVVETPKELWRRIAKAIAQSELSYGTNNKNVKQFEDKYFEMMNNLEFLSGGTLIWAGMNSGEDKVVMSKCFVLPIEDSIDGIFYSLKNNIEVLKRGGGTGFNFSKIRSSFATVSTTGENAAGPIEYIETFNRAQGTLKGRGGRQMGSMAILNVDHPNIEDFIKIKDDLVSLPHYNISVGITEKFIDAVKNDYNWDLVDPSDNHVKKTVKAKELWERIARHAWKSGDPGIFFLDEAEKKNTTPHLGKIEATNPCGEQPLLPYESCNLGNVNLSKFVIGFPFIESKKLISASVAEKLINWDRLKEVAELGIRFLDSIIDINAYPVREIEEMTKRTRNVGLGVMGVSDMLIKLGIPYSSPEANFILERVMGFIQNVTHEYSQKLGKEKGSFEGFEGSTWQTKHGYKHMRNSRTTTIAPTGTISIIAGCNPGIEPIFALAYIRKNSMGNTKQTVIDPLFETIANEFDFYSQELINAISTGESIENRTEIPGEVKELFKTSHEIDPKQHVRIQSSFQKFVDSGVSKTINLPSSATPNDVQEIYQLAYDLKCKGITVFRDGSRDPAQEIGVKKAKKEEIKTTTKQSNISRTNTTMERTKRDRPQTTHGTTTEVKTDQGQLYITINEDEEGLSEVFLMIGKSGGFNAGYTEALGRLISLCFRSGINPKTVVKQLKGIRTSNPMFSNGMMIHSVPDAVAKILERRIKELDEISMFKKNGSGKINVKNKDELEMDFESEDSQLSITPPKVNLNEDPNVVVDEITENDNSLESLKPQSEEHKYDQENNLDMAPECPDCGSNLEFAEGCVLCRACGYSKCG